MLDTNATLDWLVFGNPSCLPITEAIVSGRVCWVVNAALRDELAHVLGRGAVDRWRPDMARLWRTWEQHALPIEAPPPSSPQGRPRCTDTDDQKFIDLALDVGAHWLITRDKALLKLARQAQLLRLAIVTPERFPLADVPI